MGTAANSRFHSEQTLQSGREQALAGQCKGSHSPAQTQVTCKLWGENSWKGTCLSGGNQCADLGSDQPERGVAPGLELARPPSPTVSRPGDLPLKEMRTKRLRGWEGAQKPHYMRFYRRDVWALETPHSSHGLSVPCPTGKFPAP